MSTNHTTNYNLNQWEATDKVLRTEFNEDNAKIDAALKANADAAAAIQAKLGNCRIEHSTYVGDGNAGSGYPTGLTFSDEPPVLVVVVGRDSKLLALHSETQSSFSMDGGLFQVSWTDSGVTWWHVSNPNSQFNAYGTTYHVLMIYTAL